MCIYPEDLPECPWFGDHDAYDVSCNQMDREEQREIADWEDQVYLPSRDAEAKTEFCEAWMELQDQEDWATM